MINFTKTTKLLIIIFLISFLIGFSIIKETFNIDDKVDKFFRDCSSCLDAPENRDKMRKTLLKVQTTIDNIWVKYPNANTPQGRKILNNV